MLVVPTGGPNEDKNVELNDKSCCVFQHGKHTPTKTHCPFTHVCNMVFFYVNYILPVHTPKLGLFVDF